MRSLTFFSDSRFKTGVLALAAAGLGALISAQIGPDQSAPEVDAAHTSASNASRNGAKEVQRLKAQVSEIRGRLHQVEDSAARAASAASPKAESEATDEEPEDDSDERSPPADPELKKPTPKMAHEFYGETLRDEPRDAAWASTKERDIEAVMEAKYDSRLVSVECGSTLCRAVVDHVDEDKRQPFLTQFISDPTFGTSCFFMRMEEGASTQIFCARDGEALPRVELALQE